LSKDDKVAAFVMESGAQVAGGVVIYPKGFQNKISKICKKHNVLFVLDEIATGFGRLGSMVQYTEQKSIPDIVAFGKMLTGGYLTMAATLASKKIYESFLGEFNDWRHLFHGHTYTGNPIAAAVSLENLKLYQKNNLIKKIQKTSKVFEKYYDKILQLDSVGDIRHKGMLMGIELVTDKKKKIPIHPKKSINKIFFEEGKKNGIYLRTLGNIVMLVPPLAISEKELELLLNRTILTIKSAQNQVI
jgi:adenosylmethionine-8-amino-7-oxononanoate aminotransferase